MLAVIATAVVHYMEGPFYCWVVVQVATGHTHRGAQCVPMCGIAVSYRCDCQVMIGKT